MHKLSRAPMLMLALLATAGAAAQARYFGANEKPPAAPARAEGGATARPTTAVLDLTEPILVQAQGRDFRWIFRISGPDGELGTGDDIRAGDELHLPLGADVEVRLVSDDYIYTFTNAELQLREIAVPDLTYRLSFRAASTGRFDLTTDPMCGLRMLHDDLMGRVIIEPETEFHAWLASIE